MMICEKNILCRYHCLRVSSFFVVALLLVLLSFNTSSAAGFKEISAPELKQLTDSKKDFLIINVLSGIEYAIQHITGSINIPIDQMKSTDMLPLDKNVTLVFHCLSDR